MITTVGKQIIAKYLIGQTPSYASYMAFGCGAKPLGASQNFDDASYLLKESLDFEMFRVPIISRGYVTEYDEQTGEPVSKVVLTAELPTEERYSITEVGLYSAGSNSLATSNDSRNLLSFSTSEGWRYHSTSASTLIETQVSSIVDGDGIILSSELGKSFGANANNQAFANTERIKRHEPPRFLNNAIFVVGNSSEIRNSQTITAATANGVHITYTTAGIHGLAVGDVISVTGASPTGFNSSNKTITAVTSTTFEVASTVTGNYSSGGTISLPRLVVYSGQEHIDLLGFSAKLSKNSPEDELRLAFSVINKNGSAQSDNPTAVRLILEFSDAHSDGQHARLEVDLSQGTGGHAAKQHDFVNNRYIVINKKIKDLTTTSGFTWEQVKQAKVYVSVIDGNGVSNNYYVALDALRLENVSTKNPLYGLVGYSVVKNNTADINTGIPILKDINTLNITEFRFALDVV